MKKDKDNFDSQFKDIIKTVIKEENYFTKEDVKNLVSDILKEIDPLIAKRVKDHFREIADSILNKLDINYSKQQTKDERKENAKTS